MRWPFVCYIMPRRGNFPHRKLRRRQIEKGIIFQSGGRVPKIQAAKRYDRPDTFALEKLRKTSREEIYGQKTLETTADNRRSNDRKPNEPPATLGKAGAHLWRAIMTEYAISDSGGREILRQACVSADRAAECAAIIERDGYTVRTPQGIKDHPLLSTNWQRGRLLCARFTNLGSTLSRSACLAGRRALATACQPRAGAA